MKELELHNYWHTGFSYLHRTIYSVKNYKFMSEFEF
jgi:hypothetical protein